MLQEGTVPYIHIGRYIDPLSDFGFKFLFGSEPNKELLIALLNELFEGKKYIEDLTYNKNENHGPQNDYRASVYDLTCTGQDGEQFIIEVQRIQQRFFKDRAIYYTSNLIHEQGPKGEIKWNFQLKEVYFIALMGFCFEDTKPDSWLHRAHLTYEETGEGFYNKLGYIFIEIPKFNKTEIQLTTDLDRWLYILKNMRSLKKISVYLNKRIFQKLFTIAEVSNLSKEEYMKYERSLMEKWDEYARLTTAEEKGMEKGIEKGIEIGIDKGIEKGEQKKSIEVVKNLLETTEFSFAKIAGIAGVTENFVREVKKNMK